MRHDAGAGRRKGDGVQSDTVALGKSKTLPDIASLISLSDIYQISLDELLKGDPKMTEKVKRTQRTSTTGECSS